MDSCLVLLTEMKSAMLNQCRLLYIQKSTKAAPPTFLPQVTKIYKYLQWITLNALFRWIQSKSQQGWNKDDATIKWKTSADELLRR